MELTFDQAAELLDEMAEQFPPVFFDELNGGILLELYYGSFLASARREHWDEKTWKEELYTTLAHELTHHVEHLANAHGLDDKDEEQLLQLMQEYAEGN